MRTVTVMSGCVLAGLLSTCLVGAATVSAADPSAPSAPATSVRTAAKPTLSHLAVTFTKRSGAFVRPTQVTSARDGSARLFVAELGGVIRVYAGAGKVQAKPYLDLASRISHDGGERGLLGVAFAPNFPKKHYLWVTYVAPNGSMQLSRFKAKSVHAKTVKASTEKKILNVAHPNNNNHNGGSLAFGKSGNLFVGTGDGGGGGDAPNNAQNRRSLLGKILRIDVTRSCGGKAYCVPKTNPYKRSATAKHAIWALGLRNPWRTSIDPKTGALWIGDVGQDAYEEIDRIPAGKAGWNLGWSCREAGHVYNSSRCTGAKLHGPVASYSHSQGIAVIGGFVYRGSKYTSLIGGRYVYGDFGSGNVWLRGTSGATRVVGSLDGISSFGVGSNGEVFAVDINGGLYAMKVRKV